MRPPFNPRLLQCDEERGILRVPQNRRNCQALVDPKSKELCTLNADQSNDYGLELLFLIKQGLIQQDPTFAAYFIYPDLDITDTPHLLLKHDLTAMIVLLRRYKISRETLTAILFDEHHSISSKHPAFSAKNLIAYIRTLLSKGHAKPTIPYLTEIVIIIAHHNNNPQFLKIPDLSLCVLRARATLTKFSPSYAPRHSQTSTTTREPEEKAATSSKPKPSLFHRQLTALLGQIYRVLAESGAPELTHYHLKQVKTIGDTELLALQSLFCNNTCFNAIIDQLDKAVIKVLFLTLVQQILSSNLYNNPRDRYSQHARTLVALFFNTGLSRRLNWQDSLPTGMMEKHIKELYREKRGLSPVMPKSTLGDLSFIRMLTEVGLTSRVEPKSFFQAQNSTRTQPDPILATLMTLAQQKSKILSVDIFGRHEKGCTFYGKETTIVIAATQKRKYKTLCHELGHAIQYFYLNNPLAQTPKKQVAAMIAEMEEFTQKAGSKYRKRYAHILTLRRNTHYPPSHYPAEIHAELVALFHKDKRLSDLAERHCPKTFAWYSGLNKSAYRKAIRELPPQQRHTLALARSPSR